MTKLAIDLINISYELVQSYDADEMRVQIIDKLRKYNEPMLGYWGKSTNIVISVKDGEKLIGGLVAFFAGYYSKIGWLCVDDEYRGNGIARELIMQFENHIKEAGCTMVHVDTFNEKAADLYVSSGYIQIGKIDNFIKNVPCYFFNKAL